MLGYYIKHFLEVNVSINRNTNKIFSKSIIRVYYWLGIKLAFWIVHAPLASVVTYFVTDAGLVEKVRMRFF